MQLKVTRTLAFKMWLFEHWSRDASATLIIKSGKPKKVCLTIRDSSFGQEAPGTPKRFYPELQPLPLGSLNEDQR